MKTSAIINFSSSYNLIWIKDRVVKEMGVTGHFGPEKMHLKSMKFRPFEEKQEIAHAHTHTCAKAFRNKMNCMHKSNC